MVFTVLKWLGKIIFPDMWLYEIQILVFIIKFCWNAATLIIYVLSVTVFALQWGNWVAATETAYLDYCLCTIIFFYAFCYQFIPIVSKKKYTLNGFLLRHIEEDLIWIIIPNYMVQDCLSCNDTITVLKIYTICWLRTPHNIPNLRESNSQEN